MTDSLWFWLEANRAVIHSVAVRDALENQRRHEEAVAAEDES